MKNGLLFGHRLASKEKNICRVLKQPVEGWLMRAYELLNVLKKNPCSDFLNEEESECDLNVIEAKLDKGEYKDKEMFINELRKLFEREPKEDEKDEVVQAQADAIKKFFSYLIDKEEIFADRLIALESEEMEYESKEESSIKEEDKKIEDEDLQHKIKLKIQEEVQDYNNLENILLAARNTNNHKDSPMQDINPIANEERDLDDDKNVMDTIEGINRKEDEIQEIVMKDQDLEANSLKVKENEGEIKERQEIEKEQNPEGNSTRKLEAKEEVKEDNKQEQRQEEEQEIKSGDKQEVELENKQKEKLESKQETKEESNKELNREIYEAVNKEEENREERQEEANLNKENTDP